MATINKWQTSTQQVVKKPKKRSFGRHARALAILFTMAAGGVAVNEVLKNSGPDLPIDTTPISEPLVLEPTQPAPAPAPTAEPTPAPQSQPAPAPTPEPEPAPAPEPTAASEPAPDVPQPIPQSSPQAEPVIEVIADGMPPLPRARPDFESRFGNVETIMSSQDLEWRDKMPASFKRPSWHQAPRVSILDAPRDAQGNIDTQKLYDEGDLIINTTNGDRTARLVIQDTECMADLSEGQRCVIEYSLIAIGKDGLGITPNQGADGRGSHYQMFTESLDRSGETTSTNTSGAWPYYKPRAQKATVLGARAAWLAGYGEPISGASALHGTGTPNIDPTNNEVSLGCYRMFNQDVIDLFARVLDVDDGLLDADTLSATNVFILEDSKFSQRIITLDGYAAYLPAYQDDATKQMRLAERKSQRITELAASYDASNPPATSNYESFAENISAAPLQTAMQTQTSKATPPLPRPRPSGL